MALYIYMWTRTAGSLTSDAPIGTRYLVPLYESKTVERKTGGTEKSTNKTFWKDSASQKISGRQVTSKLFGRLHCDNHKSTPDGNHLQEASSG